MPYVPRKDFVPIDVLETYLTICETGSFTRASELLGLTQPAVSAQIKRLQQIVGGDLLSKSGGAIVQSDKAKHLQKYARRMLQLNDEVLNLSSFGRMFQTFRIGVSASFSEPLLVNTFTACSKVAGPDCSLKFKSAVSDELIKDIENGYIDLALVILSGSSISKTVAEWTEPLVWTRSADLVVRPGSPVPIVSLENSYLHRVALSAIEESGLNAVLKFAGGDFFSCYMAVKSGLGFFALPLRAKAHDLQLAKDRFLPLLPLVRVGVIAREGLDTDRWLEVVEEFTASVMAPTPAAQEGQRAV